MLRIRRAATVKSPKACRYANYGAADSRTVASIGSSLHACGFFAHPPIPSPRGLGALTCEGQELRAGSLSTTAREAGRCRSGAPARVAAGGSRRGSARDGPLRVAGPARKWAAGAASARAVILRLHRTGRLLAWPGPGGASKGDCAQPGRATPRVHLYERRHGMSIWRGGVMATAR